MSTADVLERELAARDPDVRLMLQVRDDVDGAFATLVDRYQNRLRFLLTHLTGSSQTADTLAQQVFLRLHRTRKGYRPKGPLALWIFAIANQLALGRRPGPAVAAAPPSEATQTAPLSEPAQAVQRAFASLEPDQRLAVLLSKFEHLRYAEIAEVMGRPPAAIKSLLTTARMTLRERLEPHLRSAARPAADSPPPGRLRT